MSIHMSMAGLWYMEPAIGIIPGTEFITIHVPSHLDMAYTGIPGPGGVFLLASELVGSAGDFIHTVVGGAPVDIAMVIVMAIAVDTGEVPGPDIELDIGRAREVLHEMFTVTGLQGFEQEMSRDLNKLEIRIQEHENRQNRIICIQIKREMYISEIKMAVSLDTQDRD